jgi:tetratricopeptide (TPR) repeat protein
MQETLKRAEFERLAAAAVAHHQAGRLREAEAWYHAALEVVPGHTAVMHNLGVLAIAQNNHAAAIELFDALIAAEPRYASAHYHRAVSLNALGRLGDAIHGYARAVALEPEHYASHRALGFLLLAEGNRERALDHFARTYELRRGEDRADLSFRSLSWSTSAKLRHDGEQFRYLARKVRDGHRFDALAKIYETIAKDFDWTATKLSDAQLHALGEDYNTAIHLAAAPECPGGALRKRTDVEDITRQFRSHSTGAVFFDDLLTDEALAALRRYLLESTIWHDFSHIGGFVASYLEDGLACPLVLQIADELRAAFPKILGPHPLSQAWAFKGLQPTSAVDIHADDAAVTVNFWVTETEANLKPGRGGLVVCRTTPPSDWVIEDYEADQKRIVAFLERNAGHTLHVPYRHNRAVLFESRLFHYSDAPEFRLGYENHRISVTLLFGVAGTRALEMRA